MKNGRRLAIIYKNPHIKSSYDRATIASLQDDYQIQQTEQQKTAKRLQPVRLTTKEAVVVFYDIILYMGVCRSKKEEETESITPEFDLLGGRQTSGLQSLRGRSLKSQTEGLASSPAKKTLTPESPCDVLHNRLKHRLSDENIHVELKYKDILDEGHRRQKKR